MERRGKIWIRHFICRLPSQFAVKRILSRRLSRFEVRGDPPSGRTSSLKFLNLYCRYHQFRVLKRCENQHITLKVAIELTIYLLNFTKLATTMWTNAVVHPAMIQHRNGNGNMAYVTNTINNTYHTKYSWALKPKPAPTKPVNKNYVDVFQFSRKNSSHFTESTPLLRKKKKA